ncbi:restriction endonuclease subunit S [Occallatibacter riparius]|uniref:Restriction endonuclease subunit S n=1 Tax=Occallatibacter riparius TaxID=1002689 RepID=A0A9J7BJ46_9BACT|nr:restriction endonuclease subunit S [Occallatibacter riparius]UWZ81818.1 restriction endonuclease subunit S [Occallatibacter riparius]
MKLPRYTKYKDSGVKWLGQVPEHWELHRVKSLFEIKKRIAGKEGYDVLSITQRGLQIRDVESNDGQLAADYSKYQFVKPGDFAMNHMDLLTGYIDISGTFGVTSPDYRVFSTRPTATIHDRYFLYLFQNAYREKIFYAFGQGASHLGRWRLPADQFNNLALPVPPKEEQIAICSILDYETEKINVLVEEQQRMIELLTEKRQAIIAHAVTKGHNSSMPMKASGIKWLGSIPANWELSRLKNCCYGIVDCKNRTPEEKVDGGFFVVRTTCVRNGTFCSDGGYFTDEKSYVEWTKKGTPREGDVLFTREAPAGEACLVPKDLVFCLGQRMMYLRPDTDKILSEYLLYSIYGPLIRGRIDAKSKGSTVNHLRVGEVGELPILVPSIPEQREIVRELTAQLSTLSSLMAHAAHAIALLQERRSALISAAVTGQIDVRNYRPEEAHAVCQ